MSDQTYFHIGIVVPDLAEAVEHYTRLLGVTFTEPATFHIPRLEDPDPHPHDLVAVFSRQGPPYYELIQAGGDGIFSMRSANCLLYVGVWEDDIPGRIEKLKAAGVGIDAYLKDTDGNPFVIVTAPDRYGMRIEYVGEGAHHAIDEWVATGELPGQVAQ